MCVRGGGGGGGDAEADEDGFWGSARLLGPVGEGIWRNITGEKGPRLGRVTSTEKLFLAWQHLVNDEQRVGGEESVKGENREKGGASPAANNSAPYWQWYT